MWTHQKTEPWNMKQKWISPKGEIENSKLELGPSVPLSANDTLLEKKKIHKYNEDLNITMNQENPTDIYRTLHSPTAEKYIFKVFTEHSLT